MTVADLALPDVTEVVEAGTPSTPSSSTTEVLTAKDAEAPKPAEGQGDEPKPSSETAKPNENDDSKLPFHQHPRWKEVYGENKEMKESLGKLKEFGIESPEQADFLRREADHKQAIISQLEARPLEFFADMQKAYPEQYAQVVSTVIADYLQLAEDSYRRSGDEDVKAKAETIRELRDAMQGNATRRTQTSHEDTERRQFLQERSQDFNERVETAVESSFTDQINKLVSEKGIVFASDRQREKFTEMTLSNLTDALDKDQIFCRERDQAQHPRNGQNKAQIKNVVSIYDRAARTGRKLETAVNDMLGIMNLSTKAKAETPARREITAPGAPTTGSVPQDAKQAIRDRLTKEGYSGSDHTARYLTEVAKLRLSK